MLVESLKSFGLTGHEAQVYISNVQKGEQTGYELANLTGIARSNVYAALASLLEKGIVYKVSEDPARYAAISPKELSSRVLRSFENSSQEIIDQLKPQKLNQDLVISLENEEIILNKIIYLISHAASTIYLDASAADLTELAEDLRQAQQRGVKVVIISLGKSPAAGMLVYENQSPASWLISAGRPVRLIIDSGTMLTAELGRGKSSRGIYSSNTTLVMMAKHSFIQEIILAEVRSKYEKELTACFGSDFNKIRQKVAGK
jgi:sugar-specific transcriptional regulator TrmB